MSDMPGWHFEQIEGAKASRWLTGEPHRLEDLKPDPGADRKRRAAWERDDPDWTVSVGSESRGTGIRWTGISTELAERIMNLVQAEMVGKAKGDDDHE